MFRLGCTSDKIWNLNEFLEFLSTNQNKNIDIKIFPEAVCLESLGVYKLLDLFSFNQVNIRTCNPFESSDKYNIVFLPNTWFNQQQSIDPALHSWNLKKIFFCFYHRPTASRLGLSEHLFNNYYNNSLIHFSASLDDNNLTQFELDKLLSYNINSVHGAGKIITHLPILLSPLDGYTSSEGYYYDDPLTNFYQDIFIDVVSESHVLGNTFFPTEKTIRPMWLKKPFIIFGSRNYLDYLHQMGFRTFNDFWDETYDGYEGRDRFNRILKLIDQLAQKSIRELEEMYLAMTYTLDHNYNLLKQQTFNTKLTYLD